MYAVQSVKMWGNLYKGVKNVGDLCLFADMAVILSPIRVYKIPNFLNLGLLRPFLARQGGTREMVTGWRRGTGLLFKINNPFYGTYIIKNK